MDYKSFPCEFKAGKKKGEFEGYVSVFNNVDLGDEIIVPGAFKEVVTNRQKKLKICLYHDTERMAGLADFSEDSKGFHLRGKLSLGVSYVKDAYQLMMDEVLDEMSVGYDILKGGYEFKEIDGKELLILKALKLWEGSIVPFGMNPEAQILDVKSNDLRGFEAYLRSKHGLSRKAAQAVVAYGKKTLLSDSVNEVHLSDSDVGRMLDSAEFLL